jgi:hypothetical protein
MTRAKDISKITTDANFGGTLDVTGETTLSTHLNMGDNDIIKLGDSADLQIYHDGSHSYVKDNGTGNLLIQGSTAIVLEDPDGNNMIYAEDGGPVYLYNNGSQKLATTSTGIDVTGTVTADRLLSIDTTGTNYSMIENRGAGALKDTLVLRNFSSNSGTGAKLIFAPTTSDVTTRHSAIAGVQNVNNNIDLRFYTSSGNDPVERMRIAQNGDISFYEDTGTTPKLFWDASAESLGIGTSSPASLLEIKATSLNRANGIALRGSGANDVLYMYPSADNVATIEHLIDGTTNTGGVLSINPQGGNVGIGTSSPSQKVQVSGAGSQYVSVVSTNSGNTGVLFGDSGQVDQGYVLYANSDDSLRIGTSNTERMRIRSTGKIGLGTSNADAELHIEPVSGGANASILLSNDGRTQYFRIQNNETDDALTFNANDTSERMRIDSSGNVGIGTTSPQDIIDIRGGANSSFIFGSGANGADSTLTLEFRDRYGTSGFGQGQIASFIKNVRDGSSGDYDLTFGTNTGTTTNASERMRINSSGVLLVGITDANDIATTQGASITGAGSGITRSSGFPVLVLRKINNYAGEMIRFVYNGSTDVGSIDITSSSTSYNTSSDHRLKENVTADWDATTRLKQLNPVRFNFIADADTTVDGFLAHEVQSVVPEAITGTHNEVKVWREHEELPDGVSVGDNKLDDDGNTIPVYQGIDQSKLVPLLVKTIQELEARIVALENAE